MESVIIDTLKRVIVSCETLIEWYSTLKNIKENPSQTKCNCVDSGHHKSFGQKMAEMEKEHIQELEHHAEELEIENKSLMQKLGLKKP